MKGGIDRRMDCCWTDRIDLWSYDSSLDDLYDPGQALELVRGWKQYGVMTLKRGG